MLRYFSRRLVALKEDVDLDIASLEELRYLGPDKSRLKSLYTQLEFKRLLPKLDALDISPAAGGSSAPRKISTEDYTLVDDREKLARLAATLMEAEVFGVAVETETRRAIDTAVWAFAFCPEPGRAYFVPVGYPPEVGAQLCADEVFSVLREVLENSSTKKISARTKFFTSLCARFGVSLAGIFNDTTLASYLLEPDETNHGVGAVSRKFLGHDPFDSSEIAGQERKKRNFIQAPLEAGQRVLGEQAEVALRASSPLLEALREAAVESVLVDVELPLVPVLGDMERAGIRIDVSLLEKMSPAFWRRAGETSSCLF